MPMTSETRADADSKAPIALPPKSARYDSLDFWRGVSCLALVVFHATMQLVHRGISFEGDARDKIGAVLSSVAARTWIGVPIFFVISGYCIMATIDSRRRKGSGVGEYVHRRARRIYPPYLIALALSCAAIYVVEKFCYPGLLSDGIFTIPKLESLSGWQWLGNFTLAETWRPYVVGGHSTMILPNTWTLCYEEQFYAVAGVILFAAPRRIFQAAAVVTILSVGIKVASKVADVQLEGLIFDGRWLIVAAGILVYYRINYATAWQARAIYALLALGVLFADRDPRMLLSVQPNRSIERFVAYAFALLICLLYPYDKRMSAWKWTKPITFCGGMSYSIYLMHPLVTKGISHGMFLAGWNDPFTTCFVVVPLCLATSLAVAWVFHRLVERRFINSGSGARSPSRNTAEYAGVVKARDLKPAV
jgi:peptidoglycan/LPS O-acetylase OafA/YrhL